MEPGHRPRHGDEERNRLDRGQIRDRSEPNERGTAEEQRAPSPPSWFAPDEDSGDPRSAEDGVPLEYGENTQTGERGRHRVRLDDPREVEQLTILEHVPRPHQNGEREKNRRDAARHSATGGKKKRDAGVEGCVRNHEEKVDP